MSNPQPLPRRMWKASEVAEMLGISRDQVYRLINNDKLKVRTTGRYYLISEEALQEFLNGADDPMESAS